MESQHIIETFDQCANSLINHINEYSEKYKYTGWNFISDSKLCVELNDRTIKYPIYLRIIKDPMNDNLYSIKDRTLKNKNINRILLTINTAWNSIESEADLANCFGHEFTHAFDMYLKDINLIVNEHPINDKDEDVKNLNLNISEINEINDIIYCLLPSEQRAHINGTIKYLNKNLDKILFDHFSDMIKFSTKVSILDKFIDAIESLKTKTYYYYHTSIDNLKKNDYLRFIDKYYKFAYLIKKYGRLKISNINQDKILNIDNISIEEKLEVIKDINEKIYDEFIDYKDRLFDAVYNHVYSPLNEYWNKHNIRIPSEYF